MEKRGSFPHGTVIGERGFMYFLSLYDFFPTKSTLMKNVDSLKRVASTIEQEEDSRYGRGMPNGKSGVSSTQEMIFNKINTVTMGVVKKK
jgi:hypothetical protein